MKSFESNLRFVALIAGGIISTIMLMTSSFASKKELDSLIIKIDRIADRVDEIRVCVAAMSLDYEKSKAVCNAK